MPTAPLFSANDLSSWYGSGTLTSRPNAGASGTSGLYGGLGALPSVGTQSTYNWQDITEPYRGTPGSDDYNAIVNGKAVKDYAATGTAESADYRPLVRKGAKPLPAYLSRYDASLLDAAGKAKADIAAAGTAASADYRPALAAGQAPDARYASLYTASGTPPSSDYGPMFVSPAAKYAYGLAERAKQEAAAGRQENRERGNAILAGYDQSIANNRAMADTYQPQFETEQTAARDALGTGYSQAQSGLLDRYNRNMGMVNSYGDSMRSDLMDQYNRNLAASSQSAIRRGLGNTTILNSLNRGVERDYARSNLDLEDRLLQNRLQTDQSLSADYLNSLVGGGAAMSALRERQGQQGYQLREANLGRENQGVYARLGFLGGIQNDYPTSADYGNYLLQAGVLEETKGSRNK